MLKRRPPVDPALAERARYNRNHMTKEEKQVWYQYLSCCGYPVKRQYVISPFIVDFYCAEAALVIEIDGVQHHRSDYDVQRTEYLENFGLMVVRLDNRQVNQKFEDVKCYLSNLIRERVKQLKSRFPEM